MGQVSRVNPGSCVGHGKDKIIFVLLCRNSNYSTFWRKLECIGEQIANNFIEVVGNEIYRNALFFGVENKINTAGSCIVAVGFHRHVHTSSRVSVKPFRLVAV